MLRMIHAARAHGMKVMLGSMVESSLGAVGRRADRPARRLPRPRRSLAARARTRSTARRASTAGSSCRSDRGSASRGWSRRRDELRPASTSRSRRHRAPRSCSRCSAPPGVRARHRTPAALALRGLGGDLHRLGEPVADDALRVPARSPWPPPRGSRPRCCGVRAPPTWIVVGEHIARRAVRSAQALGARSLFNASQATLTMFLAGGIFGLLGGPIGGLESLTRLPTGELTAARLLLPTLGLFVIYLLVNRALVAVAVSWSTERPYLRVLRQDWFYTERLLEDAAAFLLSPLMVVTFESIGYVGAVLFYAPLKLMQRIASPVSRAAHRPAAASSTPSGMAAKGEMAAEVGTRAAEPAGGDQRPRPDAAQGRRSRAVRQRRRVTRRSCSSRRAAWRRCPRA